MSDETDINAKERSLYLTQIRHLEEQVERCELECEDLEEQKEKLLRQYSSLEKTSRDQFQPLRGALAAGEEEVEDLCEQLETRRRDAIEATKTRQRRRSQQRREMEELMVELEKKRDLQAAALEQQQQRLEGIRQQVSHLQSLKKQLANQTEENKAAIHSLRERADSDRKKHAEHLQSQKEGLVKKEVSTVLKKERKEHKTSEMQLQFLEMEVPALQEESEDLVARKNQALSTRTNLKEALRQIIQERCDLEKELNQLSESVHQLTAEKKESSSSMQSSLSEVEDLCQRQRSADEERRQQESKVREMEEELEMERTRRRQLEGGAQEAAIILRRILSQEGDEASQTLMTERLVEILESYAPPRAED